MQKSYNKRTDIANTGAHLRFRIRNIPFQNIETLQPSSACIIENSLFLIGEQKA